MSERAKNLYIQCLNAYQEYLKIPNIPKTILGSANDGIIIPSYFYDNYNIPAELLFRELVSSRNALQGDRMAFDHRLLRLLNDSRGYDENFLVPKTTNKNAKKKFHVYFEVYFSKESDTPDLFSKQVSLCDIKFEWCSKRLFSQVVSRFESKSNLETGQRSVSNGDGFSGLYKIRRNEKFPKLTSEANLHTLKASVMAAHEIDAVDLVAKVFGSFVDCVNVTQAIGTQSYNWIGGTTAKSKSVIVPSGVFLAKSDTGKVNILWVEHKRYALPTQNLKLTANQSKVKLLNNLLRALRDETSPASSRLRRVTSEFAQAIDSDNPNLRQLGFWRCLEIATRKTSENRKDKDIIKIFQNYYPKSVHWQQQGKLIHRARNDYVHQGISSELDKPDDFYLNWSQQYAETALKILVYLYNNRAAWKTEADIDTFFDNYPRSNRELELAGKFFNERTNRKRKI